MAVESMEVEEGGAAGKEVRDAMILMADNSL
jgi:hypothetical protein